MNVKKIKPGERIRISDYCSSDSFEIDICINATMKIEICCFGLDENGLMSNDRYMIFFNQENSPDGSVMLIDENGARTIYRLDISKIPLTIKTLVFTASIDGEGQMSKITNGYFSVFSNLVEIIKFEFSGSNFENEKSIIIGQVYLKRNWNIAAVGRGFDGGLGSLLRNFGGFDNLDNEKERKATKVDDVEDEKFYFSKIKTHLQEIYKEIENGLKNQKSRVKIKNVIDNEIIGILVEYVLLDNPDIFYVDSEFRIINSKYDSWYEPKYLYPMIQIPEKIKELNDKVREILKVIIWTNMSDYEKELAIHNYLVSNVKYDTNSLNKKDSSKDIYSIFGALYNNLAVCSGYAKATKFLLDRCGIRCINITGKSFIPGSNRSVKHSWNLVKINSEYYHLDVTWDAPMDKKPDQIRFDYFNLSDRDILIDHKWNRNLYPECKRYEYNYYKYQGLIVDNILDLKKKFERVMYNRGKMIFFKFYNSSSAKINTQILNGMINSMWSEIANAGGGTVRWSISHNEKLMIYKIVFSYK